MSVMDLEESYTERGVAEEPSLRRMYRHVEITEENIRIIFGMSMDAFFAAVARKLGYAIEG
ncbi:MAG TPA: hypothetical protein VIL45_00550 [Thermoplasmata archaeon]|nr:hypothetical protein [Thermoplasmata archaeon]